VGVGFFFSLGHSTVVILMCLFVALGTDFVKTHFPEFQEEGGVIGTSVSAAFLLVIAAVNFVIFLEVYKAFRAARIGRIYSEDALHELLDGRGLPLLSLPGVQFVRGPHVVHASLPPQVRRWRWQAAVSTGVRPSTWPAEEQQFGGPTVAEVDCGVAV